MFGVSVPLGMLMYEGKTNTHLFTHQDSFAFSIYQDGIMFIQNALLFGFAFSCISASLPKTEANWQDVISDLKKFENLIQVSPGISINYLM